jgi:hypothetical protein
MQRRVELSLFRFVEAGTDDFVKAKVALFGVRALG